jgi:hypothetical protein
MDYEGNTKKRKRSSSADTAGSSSSTSGGGEYEVFLSFRGKDTRKRFTDHLYHALDNAGIRNFRDDDDLFSQLESLGFLNMAGCRGLEELKSLKLLDISGCKSIERLPDLSNTRIDTNSSRAKYWEAYGWNGYGRHEWAGWESESWNGYVASDEWDRWESEEWEELGSDVWERMVYLKLLLNYCFFIARRIFIDCLLITFSFCICYSGSSQSQSQSQFLFQFKSQINNSMCVCLLNEPIIAIPPH